METFYTINSPNQYVGKYMKNNEKIPIFAKLLEEGWSEING